MFDPYRPFGAKEAIEFAAETSGKCRTTALGRHRDLQRAPANYGGIKEIAVPRIVRDVAENSSCPTSTEHRLIDERGISGSYDEQCITDIASGEVALLPLDLPDAGESLDSPHRFRTDHNDVRAMLEQRVGLGSRNASRTNDDTFATVEFDHRGEEAHQRGS